MKIKIGSRGSKLAMLQTKQMIACMRKEYPMHEYEIVVVKTHGDQHQDLRLDQMNTSGIFVKAIEDALLHHEIDMAIHSMKDMPSCLADGLCLADVIQREDSSDVLVLRNATSFEALPKGAIIATGSKRRKYQLLQMREDLQVVPIRGNIETRLQRLEEQALDGIVLAAAALKRLQLDHRIAYTFSEEEMVPAVGQGAIAIEVRQEDEFLQQMIHTLSNDIVTRETKIERAYLYEMDGGCHTPIGARCHILTDKIALHCLYGEEDGSHLRKQVIEVPLEEETKLATIAAKMMKEG